MSAFRRMKACWHKLSSSNAFTSVQNNVFTRMPPQYHSARGRSTACRAASIGLRPVVRMCYAAHGYGGSRLHFLSLRVLGRAALTRTWPAIEKQWNTLFHRPWGGAASYVPHLPKFCSLTKVGAGSSGADGIVLEKR
ncbi:hypothetical protein [Paenibacillus sp. FSL L8-0638]|uniref:hypothetical protein n=1 Tax=Paenibacillus TaxID=44249 RepID=UPI0031588B41